MEIAPELGLAVEEYARWEHIPVAATEFVLPMADDVLDNARSEALATGAMRILAEPSFGDPTEQIIATARTAKPI